MIGQRQLSYKRNWTIWFKTRVNAEYQPLLRYVILLAMQSQIIKRTAPHWKLGLSYFGYVLIGIIPLTVFANVAGIYGNLTYKVMIAIFYIVVLPFWVKRTVITATVLFM